MPLKREPLDYPVLLTIPSDKPHMLPLVFRSEDIHPPISPDNAYPSDIPVPDFLFPEMPSYHLSSEDKSGISP